MADISLTDLTSGAIDGSGVFDQLLLRVEKSLDREYKKNRMNSTDYSKVYTSALSDTLNQSLQFVLTKQQSDKQAELLDAQARQVEQAILNDIVNNELLVKQKDKLDAETVLIQEQVNLTKAQITKLAADTQLVSQQYTNAVQERLNLIAQENKVSNESILLKQKTQTELAQVVPYFYDQFMNDANTSVHAESVVGRENALRKAQTDGFARDAEQKLCKIMVDSWTVRQTTDGAFFDYDTKLRDIDIGDMLAVARAGVNSPVSPA
jgi:hypothetical protein